MPESFKTNEKFNPDECIADFIALIKKLFFLNAKDGLTKINDISCEDDAASEFDWVVNLDIYKSSSSDSKYSNQDVEEKDHLAVGEDALLNAMAKYKNANKIIQINEIKK